jgi:GH15 family glucan-1,4-alpha-glucosidase
MPRKTGKQTGKRPAKKTRPTETEEAGAATCIADYALIGDFETAALVSRGGSIDWLCWPRFDSDACFAALLGTAENGRWRIAPKADDFRVSRKYREDTLILETRFETDEGVACLIDFMPLRNDTSDLVRLVVGVSGRVTMCMEMTLRFGYGAIVPWVSRLPDRSLRAIAGPDMVLLRTPAELRGENFKTLSEFTVAAGETVPFRLVYAASHLTPPDDADPQQSLASTEKYWRDWASKAQTDSLEPAVKRSLITLKALTYAPTGGIVAAPTTSLPEWPGGVRNWDYRFCWLRDATLTLLAFMNAGYFDEAKAWREWLLRAVAGRPEQAQIMYGVGGERRLVEWKVPWLKGFRGSAPVRIGNNAHSQLQLDVYGEVMDALHQARCGGLDEHDEGWAVQTAFVKHIEKVWTEPDESIWEVRSGPEHFTYSKVMAWVAFDRSIKSAEQFHLDGPIDHWKRLRTLIHADVCRKGYDARQQSFVRSYGSTELDASLLLLPTVGFLPPQDPRIKGTIEAVERHLMKDGLVRRYNTASADDGLPPGEGVFLACSFWMVDAYVMLGRLDDARAMFKRLVGLCNDVGLLSEEYDPESKQLLGNFPQAFSHVALVNSAFNLTRASKPAEQRADHSAAAT